MLKHDIGVLSATTAFGKTVIAAKLIAERKISTLVLTHRRQLLSQWTAKLSEFLEIDEALPVLEKKRGRKRKQSLIGQIGAGKSRPTVAREILIVSPFITRRRVSQMLPFLVAARGRDVKVVIVTRPASDFREKDRASLEETLSLFHAAGVNVAFKSNIHQKFAIFDQRIVWYGSINLLSFGRSEESIMRLENPDIADELLGSIQK
jgi:phosphatidylserine/phosphatidylglycerophosphate/cardiolipin synthase-like enzyme